MILHKNHHVFMTLMESRWKELSNGILVDVGVQKLTPTIHFPSRTLALLLAIDFGHPHQEVHIVLSLAVQVL
jgi:hypothetical protein